MITYERYFDKVYGGWIGKCLGGAAGAPVEGYKKLIDCQDYKEMLRTDLPNDDLDLQLLWLEVLQKKGFYITTEDLAYAWDKQCWYPFSEYGIFLKNYERGIMPPYSGKFNNSFFGESEGSPIRSEIWGMSFPGRPEIAAKYAEMDSSLDHYEEAVWIEQYYAAMEASAFFCSDIHVLLKQELRFLPEGSRARECVMEVFQYYSSGNRDWIKARKRMLQKYGHHDFTNAVTNLGIVIIALLYGENSLDKIINIAFRCGYDTDCTCATAAALYGIIIGYEAMDHSLKKAIGDTLVVGIAIDSKNRSIQVLAQETCEIGMNARVIGGCEITEVPKEIIVRGLPEEKKEIDIQVRYRQQPAIGYMDCCEVDLQIINQTDQRIEEQLILEQIPSNWETSFREQTVTICAGETLTFKIRFVVNEWVNELHNTNKMTIRLGEQKKVIGIAGAMIWKVIGPFTEALEKEDREGLPSPHGEGCILPTLECMVNNAVYLKKSYINESKLEEAFHSDYLIMNAYEDLLPLDEVLTYQGQGCVYLEQTIISPEERDVWLVIGNNDGFQIWMNQELVMSKDEIRLWTPYNNYEIVKMRKGENKVVLKLLRRTEALKFSFGVRKCEGEHFHRKRWYVDFVSKIENCTKIQNSK